MARLRARRERHILVAFFKSYQNLTALLGSGRPPKTALLIHSGRRDVTRQMHTGGTAAGTPGARRGRIMPSPGKRGLTRRGAQSMQPPPQRREPPRPPPVFLHRIIDLPLPASTRTRAVVHRTGPSISNVVSNPTTGRGRVTGFSTSRRCKTRDSFAAACTAGILFG